MSWTRAQVAIDHLGVPVSTLRSWERATGFKPSGQSAFQEFTPTSYDAADIALLQVLQHASNIGITGTELARVLTSAEALRPHLQPGWTGMCVTATDGRAWLTGPGVPGQVTVDDIAAVLDPSACIQVVARVAVPT